MTEAECYSNGLYALSFIVGGMTVGYGLGWNIIQKEAMPNGTWKKHRLWQIGLIGGALGGMITHHIISQIS